MQLPSKPDANYTADELAAFRRQMAEQEQRGSRAGRTFIIGAVATGPFLALWLQMTSSGWLVWGGLLPLVWVFWGGIAMLREMLAGCPACHRLVGSREHGGYCPFCKAQYPEQHQWAISAPKCSHCERNYALLFRRRSPFCSKFCTHCGIQLRDSERRSDRVLGN